MLEPPLSFIFERPRIDKLSRSELLSELEFVAARLGFNKFGKRDFRQFGKYSVDPILSEFGSWTLAMAELAARLGSRGIELKSRLRGIPKSTIFAEMERIWRAVGHRPSRAEWTASLPTVRYNLIRKRFGGWRNACVAFIEYKNADFSNVDLDGVGSRAWQDAREIVNNPTVRAGLRMAVLIRDSCTCCICGRNPKTHPGLVLHVDHIRPSVKGGRTAIENLQTTCEACNLGKGAQEIQFKQNGRQSHSRMM
jgi:HNH endonuclease